MYPARIYLSILSDIKPENDSGTLIFFSFKNNDV